MLQIGQFNPAPAGRTDPSPVDLEQWVVDTLNAHLAGKQEFTAFSITAAIRSAQPGFNIRHDDVRELVHGYMNTILQTGIYETEDRDYNGNLAVTYIPAP